MARQPGVAACAAALLVCLAAVAAVAAKSRVQNTPTNALAAQVLNSLIATPLGRTLPALPWDFYLIDDYEISASSDGAGRIFVSTGMAAWYLGQSRGIWAAVLGHEIGHALLHHPASWPAFQSELAALAPRAPGDRAARPLLGHSGAARFNVRSAQQREYAADYIALMLMAEAGYHPDYALRLDRWMVGSQGDTAPLVGFLAAHPPWHDREEQAQKSKDMALAIFNSRWPHAAQSPGGLAPPDGKLGSITVGESVDQRELTIHVPVTVRKATGVDLRVAVAFLAGRTRVPSKLPEFRAPDGSLALNFSFDGQASREMAREVTFSLPLAALATTERKLRMVVFFVAGDIVLDVAYVPVAIKFPE
ncbi:MAG TPA: M48 family metallopeptidase [Terriglobia bacterium]|nr:M48 family metallopeptidase [Terriglobia bacterium]